MKSKKTIAKTKKYADGGKMRLSKNLTESRKAIASKKTTLKKTRKMMKNMRKMVSTTIDDIDCNTSKSPIVFNTEMRKTFIKGVLQDIKGYFESKTDGKVEVSYEEFELGSHEFAFKLKTRRSSDCSKQLFSEVGSAMCNVVNYMFPADEFEKFDLTTFVKDEMIEFEIVSNW